MDPRLGYWRVDEVLECLPLHQTVPLGRTIRDVERALLAAMPDAYEPSEEVRSLDLENCAPGDAIDHARLLGLIWPRLSHEVRAAVNAAALREFGLYDLPDV